jgi:ribonuclease P/MRP protein subunit RPP1
MNIDFVRFNPPRDIMNTIGYDDFVIFSENPSDQFSGYLVRCEDCRELLLKLRKAKKDWIVGVLSNDVKVNREAVMRKRVDVLLDSSERKLDYATLRMATEKDVVIELTISKFINTAGLKRMKIFEETMNTLNLIKKFDTPFVLTSGASNFHELRPKRQIYDLFSFMGADVKRNEFFMQKLVRRYRDPNYIANGLEIYEG